jgi:hypothetical protein
MAQQALAVQTFACDGLENTQAELSALAETRASKKCFMNPNLAIKARNKGLPSSDTAVTSLIKGHSSCPEAFECPSESRLSYINNEPLKCISSKAYHSVDAERPASFLTDSAAKVKMRSDREDMHLSQPMSKDRSEVTSSKGFDHNSDIQGVKLFVGDSEAEDSSRSDEEYTNISSNGSNCNVDRTKRLKLCFGDFEAKVSPGCNKDDINNNNNDCNMERDRWSSLDERLGSSTLSSVWTHQSEPLERIDRASAKEEEDDDDDDDEAASRSVKELELKRTDFFVEQETSLSSSQREAIGTQFPNRVSSWNPKFGGRGLDLNTSSDGDYTWGED